MTAISALMVGNVVLKEASTSINPECFFVSPG